MKVWSSALFGFWRATKGLGEGLKWVGSEGREVRDGCGGWGIRERRGRNPGP